MEKCAIILAGGEGKRMKSDKPKPMAEVLGKPMLRWVIDSVRNAGVENICVLTGYHKEYIEDYVKTLDFPVTTVEQKERLGTGHAVMMCKEFLENKDGDVCILCGDAPFMDTKTVSESYKEHNDSDSSATVISAVVDDPSGYGRIVRNEEGLFKAIVETKDANEEELKIDEINSGGYWFDIKDLMSVLYKITSDNNANEYYLPDALKLLLRENKKITAFVTDNADAVLGANDPAQLEELNQIAIKKGYN